jgi:hypothetical protein
MAVPIMHHQRRDVNTLPTPYDNIPRDVPGYHKLARKAEEIIDWHIMTRMPSAGPYRPDFLHSSHFWYAKISTHRPQLESCNETSRLHLRGECRSLETTLEVFSYSYFDFPLLFSRALPYRM